MKKLVTTFFAFFIIISMYGQNTVGLISYDISRSYQGYTLIYPHNQPNVYLLNNCGEIVHTWEDQDTFRPGNTAYLRPDGSLVKTKRAAAATVSSPIWAGGGGHFVEVLDWDNNLIASYGANDEQNRLHHDISVMPNGNVLMINWELKTKEEAIAAGRDTMLLSQDKLWPDTVLEWDPTSGEIVWEWHAWDHLIQDFDATKDDFGVVADNPQLINVNYDTNDGKADWLHANALDYNADLDQIMISIPTFSELWIIDHSTTTAQAASSTGGNFASGGDLLYRVGNLQAYDKGDADDQLFFYQHDTHWVNEFVPDNHPLKGQMVVFNNRVGPDFSSIEFLPSQFDMYDNGYPLFQGSWPPYDLQNTITHPEPTSFHSTGLSSAQLLPNGNLLMCSGRQGYIVELTENNDIVWEYITPQKGMLTATQGDSLELNNNLTFRAFRYPPEYSAFENRDLEPTGWYELEPNVDWCDRLVSTSTPEVMSSIIYPNPASNTVHLAWDSGEIIDIKVYDLLGRKRIHTSGNGGMKYLDVSSLESNTYFITLNNQVSKKLIIRK